MPIKVDANTPIPLGAHISLTDATTGQQQASYVADAVQYDVAPAEGYTEWTFGSIGVNFETGMYEFQPAGVDGARGAITARGWDARGVAVSGSVDLILSADPLRLLRMSIHLQQ